MIKQLAQKPNKTMVESAIVNRYINALWQSREAGLELHRWLLEYNPEHLSGISLRNWASEIAWSILPDGHDVVTLSNYIQDIKDATV